MFHIMANLTAADYWLQYCGYWYSFNVNEAFIIYLRECDEMEGKDTLLAV